MRGHFQHGKNMVFVTVNAAGRKQPHDVQCAMPLLRSLDSSIKRRVVEETTLFYVDIDAAEFLIDDPSCANIEMPNLGIAHLFTGQAYRFFRSINQSVRVVAP